MDLQDFTLTADTVGSLSSECSLWESELPQ